VGSNPAIADFTISRCRATLLEPLSSGEFGWEGKEVEAWYVTFTLAPETSTQAVDVLFMAADGKSAKASATRINERRLLVSSFLEVKAMTIPCVVRISTGTFEQDVPVKERAIEELGRYSEFNSLPKIRTPFDAE